MVSKPLRILTFVFSAFLVLAFTAGVTQAANKFFFANASGGVGNTASLMMDATVDPSQTPDPSMSPEPSATAEPSATPEPSDTPEPSQTSESKVEFSGVITSIDLEWWTIGEYVVQVTADTEIEGDPQVGDTVSVEAYLQADGSYIAHEIETHADAMGEEESDDGEHMTSTPEYDDDYEDHHDDDKAQYTSTPDMHDDDHEEDDDHHDQNGSGSSDDDHEDDHGGGWHDGEGGGDD